MRRWNILDFSIWKIMEERIFSSGFWLPKLMRNLFEILSNTQPNLAKSYQMWPNPSDLVWFSSIWFDLVSFGRIWLDLVGFRRIWLDLEKWIWLDLVRFGKIWLNFVGFCWIWLDLAEFGWIWKMDLVRFGKIWFSKFQKNQIKFNKILSKIWIKFGN